MSKRLYKKIETQDRGNFAQLIARTATHRRREPVEVRGGTTPIISSGAVGYRFDANFNDASLPDAHTEQVIYKDKIPYYPDTNENFQEEEKEYIQAHLRDIARRCESQSQSPFVHMINGKTLYITTRHKKSRLPQTQE